VTGDGAAATAARNACAALPPVVEQLRELMEAPQEVEALGQLATAITAASLAVEQLGKAPKLLGGEALRDLGAVGDVAERLEAMLGEVDEHIARDASDIQAATGLLQNAAALSKRFAERVATWKRRRCRFACHRRPRSPTLSAPSWMSSPVSRAFSLRLWGRRPTLHP